MSKKSAIFFESFYNKAFSKFFIIIIINLFYVDKT